MNENHKDTLHIESIQQLKNKNPDLVNAFWKEIVFYLECTIIIT